MNKTSPPTRAKNAPAELHACAAVFLRVVIAFGCVAMLGGFTTRALASLALVGLIILRLGEWLPRAGAAACKTVAEATDAAVTMFMRVAMFAHEHKSWENQLELARLIAGGWQRVDIPVLTQTVQVLVRRIPLSPTDEEISAPNTSSVQVHRN